MRVIICFFTLLCLEVDSMDKVVIPEIQDEYVCIKAIPQSQIESSRFQKVKQLNEERMDIDSLKEAAYSVLHDCSKFTV